MHLEMTNRNRERRKHDKSLQLQHRTIDDPYRTGYLDKDISPWGSEQFRKTFQPGHYFQTIQKQRLRNKRRELNIGEKNKNSQTISKDFFKLLRLQKRGVSLDGQRHEREQTIKLNLVNVNLDEDLLKGWENKVGSWMSQENKNKSGIQMKQFTKQQPVRVKIFKKILEKNGKHSEEEIVEKQLSSFLSVGNQLSDEDEVINVYAALPRRSPTKLSEARKKLASSLQTRNDYLPRVSIQKEMKRKDDDDSLCCKGEIISKQDSYTKKKIKLRNFQIKEKYKNERQSLKLFLGQPSPDK